MCLLAFKICTLIFLKRILVYGGWMFNPLTTMGHNHGFAGRVWSGWQSMISPEHMSLLIWPKKSKLNFLGILLSPEWKYAILILISPFHFFLGKITIIWAVPVEHLFNQRRIKALIVWCCRSWRVSCAYQFSSDQSDLYYGT